MGLSMHNILLADELKCSHQELTDHKDNAYSHRLSYFMQTVLLLASCFINSLTNTHDAIPVEFSPRFFFLYTQLFFVQVKCSNCCAANNKKPLINANHKVFAVRHENANQFLNAHRKWTSLCELIGRQTAFWGRFACGCICLKWIKREKCIWTWKMKVL